MKNKDSKQSTMFNNVSKKMVYSFLISHLLASQFLLPYFGKNDVFPIFTWRLFSSCNEIRKATPEIEIFVEGRKEGRKRQNNK